VYAPVTLSPTKRSWGCVYHWHEWHEGVLAKP
jgi:hypothetical protein